MPALVSMGRRVRTGRTLSRHITSAAAMFLSILSLEINVKCRYLKKLTCKGTFRQVYTRIQYSILIHTGKGEGRELTSEKVRGAIVHKAGQKYQHDSLSLQSINSIKHQ
jgi:hypothetical protein